MTHHTQKKIEVNVPASKIWNILEDFSSVEKFAVSIKSSPIVGDINSGLGAKRLCTFQNGSSLVEEIVDYQDNSGYRMKLSDHTLPLKSMSAQMNVKQIDENRSEISMAADFVVKMGPVGWLMGYFLMRPVMKSTFKTLMTGLAYHAATGKCIEEKLPSKEILRESI